MYILQVVMYVPTFTIAERKFRSSWLLTYIIINFQVCIFSLFLSYLQFNLSICFQWYRSQKATGTPKTSPALESWCSTYPSIWLAREYLSYFTKLVKNTNKPSGLAKRPYSCAKHIDGRRFSTMAFKRTFLFHFHIFHFPI